MGYKIIFLGMVFLTGFATVSSAGDCTGWVKAVNGTTATVVCADGVETIAEVVDKKVCVGCRAVVKGGKIVIVKYRIMEDC